MKYARFEDFFHKATGHTPYSYQKELAEPGTHHSIVSVPTGAGKTESAVLCMWLWKRLNGKYVPKRLVYCLPMRVLAEQTHAKVAGWIKNLALEERVSVELLMGGSDTRIERILPHKECVIIGTQDMLVSGALNRAYGSSPAVWPIVFGLLNNDCMWVMDEIQIMENALPTSIQLDSFRRSLGAFGPHSTVWMSATVNPDWIKTVDFNEGASTYRLNPSKVEKALKERHHAPKTLQKAPFKLDKEYSREDVKKIMRLHEKGTTTAIIVNTVKRAQSIFKILSQDYDSTLIHSRFRGFERRSLNEWLSKFKDQQDDGRDQVIISTQVIEAGVDISVRTMITELAPWANMIQRFGRCNRYGRLHDANVFWIDMDDASFPPYKKTDMDKARRELKKLSGRSVSPGDLPEFKDQKTFDAVLRRRDIMGLFDTTPNLSGGYTDVSQFVRSLEQRLDVGVFWRNLGGSTSGQSRPEPEEICDVPIHEMRSFLKGKRGWIWSYANESWERAYSGDILPGQTVMLDNTDSGYSSVTGWDPSHTDPVESVLEPASMPESHYNDTHSKLGTFVTLEDHTRHVHDEARSMLKKETRMERSLKEAILIAAKYHDVGKAHHVFQNAVRGNGNGSDPQTKQVWAKGPSLSRYERTGFRHEVVSMLAYLGQRDRPKKELQNLAAYLILSHHGKVRLSLGIPRSRSDSSMRNGHMLGVSLGGETFPEFVSKEVSVAETDIDMSLASMGRDPSGRPSWSERTIRLRDEHGPFRLGYMETLLRRADWLASEKEGRGEYRRE